MPEKSCGILLIGASGRMGRAVAEAAEAKGCRILCGVDLYPAPAPFPVFSSLSEVEERPDAVIDFSYHTFTPEVLAFCVLRGLPAVIATTGQTGEEEAAVRSASARIPVLRSGNLSLGAALLARLVSLTAAAVDWDAEITEEHHAAKLDAPSGTALSLAEAIRAARGGGEYVYDRRLARRPREKGEIGVHSLRAGGIVGRHEILFASGGEVLRLSHEVSGRAVFAEGALAAARALTALPPGFYTLSDILFP